MFYSQHAYRCRFDWGRQGVQQAAARGDVLVIVDTLRFSSAVVTAVHHGGIIYPCSWDEDPAALARRVVGEVAALRRADESGNVRFSLSPSSYLHIEPGTRVVVRSPNGATCSRYAGQVPYLFVGALLNAQSAARAVERVLEPQASLNVTVIACGERWSTPGEDGALRVAIEDYLGAGAILSYLRYNKSPEARVCEGAFVSSRNDLHDLLWESGSGRELREKGYGEDVQYAACLNLYDTVPVMHDECLVGFNSW